MVLTLLRGLLLLHLLTGFLRASILRRGIAVPRFVFLISLLKELQVEQYQPIENLRYENEIVDYNPYNPYRVMFLWKIQRRKGTRNGG